MSASRVPRTKANHRFSQILDGPRETLHRSADALVSGVEDDGYAAKLPVGLSSSNLENLRNLWLRLCLMDGLLLPWWQEASYHHAREQEHCAWPAESVTHGLHPSAADRVADRIGGSLSTVH
jgi:hypothetical protein